nr:hypothetical protein [Tanacetum cinerariifolium]
MELTFADTHNMIAYLTELDASEGFDQIIDFLNASLIKKKVIITEATIREALRLDDEESIDCLPNEEIFTELSRMRYEKSSTKLTFYKTLVSNVDSSTKFYMYPRFLQLMIRAQVSDLSSHTTKYSSPTLTQKLFANMIRVGKGFSRVETPLFEGMIVAKQADDVADEVAAGVDVDVVPTADAKPSLPSPTPTIQPPPPSLELPSILQVIPTPPPSPIKRVKKLERKNKLKVSGLRRLRKVGTAQRVESSVDTVMDDQEDASKQGEIISNIDADENVTLKDVAAVEKTAKIEENADVLSMQDDELEPAELKEVEVVTTAKLMTEVVTAVVATITAATTLIIAATITAAPSVARRRKGVKRERGQCLVGFKIDYFKEMSYDDIRLIFEKYFNSNVAFLKKSKEQLEEEESRALKRKTKSFEENAIKKQKLDEDVEELKKHLQIVPNNDDDVYTKVTPLALKVPVVDYEIYSENNKPYFNIIRAGGTHQLFLSFLSLLRNFDREDLEVIWKLVKDRFASSKPKNFSVDFLLTTLTYMFESLMLKLKFGRVKEAFMV